MKHTEPTVTTRRSNQIRNLGKERSAEMHSKNADRIDRKVATQNDRQAARAERKARLAANA